MILDEVKALVEEYAGDTEDIDLKNTAREIVEKVRKGEGVTYMYEALKEIRQIFKIYSPQSKMGGDIRLLIQKALAKYEGRN